MDTAGTYDFGDSSSYCFMVRTTFPSLPVVRSSDEKVVSVKFVKWIPGGCLFRINRLSQGTAAIITTLEYAGNISFLAKAGPAVRTDITEPFSLKKEASYTFKITSFSADDSVPQFMVGNGSVFQTQLVKQSGRDYYFKITAVGDSGQETGIYTKMPDQNAVRHCIVKIA